MSRKRLHAIFGSIRPTRNRLSSFFCEEYMHTLKVLRSIVQELQTTALRVGLLLRPTNTHKFARWCIFCSARRSNINMFGFQNQSKESKTDIANRCGENCG